MFLTRPHEGVHEDFLDGAVEGVLDGSLGGVPDGLVGDVPSDIFQLRLFLVVWGRECVGGGCFRSDP